VGVSMSYGNNVSVVVSSASSTGVAFTARGSANSPASVIYEWGDIIGTPNPPSRAVVMNANSNMACGCAEAAQVAGAMLFYGPAPASGAVIPPVWLRGQLRPLGI
jgi:hypothetical protein